MRGYAEAGREHTGMEMMPGLRGLLAKDVCDPGRAERGIEFHRIGTAPRHGGKAAD